MADNKSREGMVTYKCMNCYAEVAVSKRRVSRMDGRNCFLCEGPIQKVENKKSTGTITVDIDVSDALKGLKAVQREARKATKELKELDEQQKQTRKRVLHIKVNGIVDDSISKKLKDVFKGHLQSGFVISDKFIQTEILEVDDIVFGEQE